MIDTILQLFDLPILVWIAEHLHCAFLNVLMPLITLFGEDGIFWIAVAVVLLFFKKTRKLGLMLGMSFLLGFLIGNCIIKPCVGRIRPYDYFADVLGNPVFRDQLLVDILHDFSFPSGHTLVSFEAASVLLLQRRKPWGWIALVLAVLVAFSRLYLFVHYPTDVLAGALLGTLFGVLSCLIVGKLWDAAAARRAAKRTENA